MVSGVEKWGRTPAWPRAVVLAWVVCLLNTTAARAGTPQPLVYQGRLTLLDGQPETGTVQVAFALFEAPQGGTALWQETQQVVLSDGYYAAALGTVVPIPLAAWDGTVRHLELTVGAETFSPRQPVASLAHAVEAHTVRHLVGGPVQATGVWVNGQPVIHPRGHWVGNSTWDDATDLLMHLDGTLNGEPGHRIFTELTSHKVVYYTAHISSAQSRFGGYSADMTAAGSILAIQGDWRFPRQQDFTVDWWFMQTEPCTNANQVLLTTTTQKTMILQCDVGLGFQFSVSTDCSTWNRNSSLGVVALNQWHHAAVVRHQGEFRVYVDGVARAQADGSDMCTTSSAPWLFFSGNYNLSLPLVGYVDEPRVSRGVARWTSNFTPPTAAY